MPKGNKRINILDKPREKAKQGAPSVGQHPFYDAMLLPGILTEKYYRRLAEQSRQKTGMHHTP